MDTIFYINIHTHFQKEEEGVVSIYNYIPGHSGLPATGKYSSGLHPWYIQEDNFETQLEQHINYVNRENCVAIGESGLDKLRGPELHRQIEVFRMDIELATELDKPLIIHCVKRFQEVLQVLKQEKFTGYFILHGFNARPENAKPFLALPNALFSFGKELMNDESNAVALLKELSPDRFFLETDDSELSIREIYSKAAQIRNVDETILKQQLIENYKRVFKIWN
ncbi:MAG TPA: TatD family hydrolase [Bacteroidia bacterium]